MILPDRPDANLAHTGEGEPPRDRILEYLATVPSLATGLYSSATGSYERAQVLLDMSQGTRQPSSLYDPTEAPLLSVPQSGDGAAVTGWAEARRRAHAASVTLRPGLLAGSIPGGAAFVTTPNSAAPETGVLAADETGHIAELSTGPASTLAARALDAARHRQLVVVAAPAAASGRRVVATLAQQRSPDDLLIVAHVPPTPLKQTFVHTPALYIRLPALAMSADRPATPASATTRLEGLSVSIDIMPTALDHLGIELPPESRGQTITLHGKSSVDHLDALRRRWSSARSGRQAGSLSEIVTLMAFLALVAGVVKGPRVIWPAVRIAGLAAMWWPTMVLLTAIVAPSAAATERAVIAVSSIVAALTTDRLLRWPRGPIAPAVAAVLAFTIDLAGQTGLLSRSALGPSVISGGRFYGVSNELEPILPVLLLAGLAAAYSQAPKSRRLCTIFAVAGIGLAVVIGWGRLGADVGGVLTVGAAFTAAVLMLLPKGITRRAVLIAAAVPVVAILGLLALDFVGGGGGHLTRNVSRSRGLTDLFELVARRYELSADIFASPNGRNSVIVGTLAVVFAFRNRVWLLDGRLTPAWTAVFVGGLAGGVVGALTNDSGPILFKNAVVALLGVMAYLQLREAPEVARASTPAT